jgi:hypothetical protein
MIAVKGSDLKTFDLYYTSCCGINELDCSQQIRDIVRKFGIENPTFTIIEIKIERDYRSGYNWSYRAGIQIQYIQTN